MRQILERHLVVSDRVYTMADLKVIANETVQLPTVRDHLKIRVKESAKSKFHVILLELIWYRAIHFIVWFGPIKAHFKHTQVLTGLVYVIVRYELWQ